MYISLLHTTNYIKIMSKRMLKVIHTAATHLTSSSFSGDPKGAMLTHENVVADAASFVKSFEVLYVTVVA